MRRDEVVAAGAKALAALIEEHGAGNRFLASEVANGIRGGSALAVGRHGHAIAGTLGRETGRLIVYVPRIRGSRDPRHTHSYFNCDE